MAFPSAITFSELFNLDTKLITLTDSVNYTGMGTGWVGYYTVTAPNGNVIYSGNSTTPDTTQSTPTPKQIFAQLDDTGTNIINGIYTFSLTLYLSTNTPTSYTVTKTVAFEVVQPTAVLDFTYNQFESSVLLSDDTNYVQQNITPTTTTLLQLTYPLSIGYLPYPSYPTALSSTTSTLPVIYDSSAQDGLFINGQYTYTLASTSTYNLGNGCTAVVSVTASGMATATATYNMASLYCSLKALKKRLDKAIKSNMVLADTYQEEYNRAVQLMEMIRDAYICNQLSEAEAYIQEFYTVTESTPDCSCDNNGNTAPILVVPITFVEDVEVISNSYPQLTVTKTVEKKGLSNFYTQFALALDLGETNNYQNLYYIDPNGNDATGLVGNPNFPFKTFAKVNTLLGSSSLVIVNAGLYNENLVFNTNRYYYLMPNVIISTSNLCDTAHSPTVYGYGIVSGTTLIVDSSSVATFNGYFEFDTLSGIDLFGTLVNGKIGNPYFKVGSLMVSNSVVKSPISQNTSGSYIKFDKTSLFCNGNPTGGLFNLASSSSTTPQLALNACTIDTGSNAGTYTYNITNNAYVVHKNVKFKSANSYLIYVSTGTFTMYNDNNCYSSVPISTGTLANPISTITYNTNASNLVL